MVVVLQYLQGNLAFSYAVMLDHSIMKFARRKFSTLQLNDMISL